MPIRPRCPMSMAMDPLPVLMFGLATACTPGPNNAMIAASGANYGYRRTLPLMLGIILGATVLFAAVAIGLGTVITRIPELQAALKALGTAFLFYLAYKIATAPPPGSLQYNRRGTAQAGFPEGFLFQPITPNAWTVGVSVVALFTQPGASYAASATQLVAILFLCGIISANVWAGFGLILGQLLTTPRRHRIFSLVMGALTAASALLIVI